jgi:hypothetical protein
MALFALCLWSSHLLGLTTTDANMDSEKGTFMTSFDPTLGTINKRLLKITKNLRHSEA